MTLLPVDAPYLWLVLALTLGIAEIIVPGFFLIWIGLAAGMTGIVAMTLSIGIVSQLVLFAISAMLFLLAGRRWFQLHPIRSSRPGLNDISARLIGERVIVVEDIVNGRGRVRIGDSIWLAFGDDVPVGTVMRVVTLERGGVGVVRA